jgi:hypothetical protein
MCFYFRSRRGTAIRLLSYDGQGYWLAQKRLSNGRFRWWPESSLGEVGQPHTADKVIEQSGKDRGGGGGGKGAD